MTGAVKPCPDRLLVLADDYQQYLRRLRRAGLDGLHCCGSSSVAEGRQQVRCCNIVLGQPVLVAQVLDRAVALQWVQSSFAGVDALCRPGLRRDYRLTAIKQVFGPLVSEYVFAHILALERHLFETRADQAARRWRRLPYRSLQGLTLGICGFGSIGAHVAGTGNHFGMKVLAYKRSPGTSPLVERVYTGAELDRFLSQIDYLVMALPDTPETEGLIDARALGRLKADTVVINVGRGSSLVQNDLQRALESGKIRAAVLDVFDHEPLPATSPLWGLPNAIVTPHNAAVSFPADVLGVFLDNYQRFKRGTPLRYQIDFERGY